MIRLGHVGVWGYPWGVFLDALEFENDLAKETD